VCDSSDFGASDVEATELESCTFH